MIPNPKPLLLVIGSINEDRVMYVEDFPAPGETITASISRKSVGGKGANQAAAAARAGANVAMLACVGNDDAGSEARRALASEGVDTAGIATDWQAPTGTAFITVSSAGENSIIIDGGANMAVNLTQVNGIRGVRDDTVVLAQGELRPDIIESVAAQAKARGLRFVLNLAPPLALSASTLMTADPLIVNEHEARAIGINPATDEIESWKEAVSANIGSLAKSLVITLGGRGAVAGNISGTTLFPVPEVTVKDTSGAGDAFCGTVAAFLAEKQPFLTAVQAGTTAGALSVRRSGTIESYPSLEEISSHGPTTTPSRTS